MSPPSSSTERNLFVLECHLFSVSLKSVWQTDSCKILKRTMFSNVSTNPMCIPLVLMHKIDTFFNQMRLIKNCWPPFWALSKPCFLWQVWRDPSEVEAGLRTISWTGQSIKPMSEMGSYPIACHYFNCCLYSIWNMSFTLIALYATLGGRKKHELSWFPVF